MLSDDDVRSMVASEGTVENEFHSPFSVPLMDAGFDFNSLLLDEIKKFTKEVLDVAEPLARIKFFSSLDVPADDAPAKSLRSATRLYLVRDSEGRLNALVFMTCKVALSPVEATKTP